MKTTIISFVYLIPCLVFGQIELPNEETSPKAQQRVSASSTSTVSFIWDGEQAARVFVDNTQLALNPFRERTMQLKPGHAYEVRLELPEISLRS